MDIYQIVKKLVGPIYPVGETNEDDRRYENLKIMTDLVDSLLTDIDRVAFENKEAHQYSLKKASDFALKFLDKIGIQE